MTELHRKAFDDAVVTLPVGGFYRYRRNGERHAYEGGLIHMMQHAVATDSYSAFKKYSEAVRKQTPINLRDLLDFRSARESISADEVESITEIRRRFVTPRNVSGRPVAGGARHA